MKLTDFLTNKFGTDKLLHYMLAGYAVSAMSPLGWLPMLIMTVVMLILSFIKEKWLDEFADYYDILAATFGIATSWLIYGVELLIQ